MPLNFSENMEDDVKMVLVSAEELRAKAAELGARISKDFAGKQPIIIGVMNGAMLFMADLMRHITIPCEIDTIAVGSYGKGATSGEVNFKKDVSLEIRGRHVIFVEDIVDTGKTLATVGAHFKDRGAESTSIVTLFDKKVRRSAVGLKMDYVGYDCPDEFIVGYGIDYAERYRNLPYVAALKPCVYE